MKDQVVIETLKKKVKADTIVHVVLDMSGSMGRIAQPTRDGLNTYLESLKSDKVDDITLVSVTVFDSWYQYGEGQKSRITTVLDAVDLNDVPTITESHYKPNGGTPLYDAIGEVISRTDKALRGIEGDPEVLLVVITDGDENTSQKFKQTDIKAMIEQKEGEGWSTIYLGANQDAWTVGSGLGIQMGNTKSYVASAAGIQNDVFSSVAGATVAYRAEKSFMKSQGMGDGYVTRSFFSEGEAAPEDTEEV